MAVGVWSFFNLVHKGGPRDCSLRRHAFKLRRDDEAEVSLQPELS
jgi:hypothetical protein